MAPNLLILGGTAQATALARRIAEAGLKAIVSLAGRVDRPVRQPLPLRVGGFGGVAGLRQYLRDNSVTHVVDATHPFAAQISRNAIAACTQDHTPLIALTRPAWVTQPGDNWRCVPTIAAAVEALDGPGRNVFLAVGRMHLGEFAIQPQHRYLLRLVDPPKTELPFANATAILDRGPFTEANDLALLQNHAIDIVVSKNAGGTATYSKIAAARQLHLPVVMIDRPSIPKRPETPSVDAVLNWISHGVTERGV